MDITQYLQSQGYSRRNIIILLQQERIFLNGTPCEYRKEKVHDGDSLTVDEVGNPQIFTVSTKQEAPVIILYHKPIGYVVSQSDPHNDTIFEHLPPEWRHIYHPIGRLDKDSHGLVLLTNVPTLVSHLAHPRYLHRKVYIITVTTPISAEEIEIGKK
jgi:16S rRNA U516 pseudouridylate synthase RsuA-like enzyme